MSWTCPNRLLVLKNASQYGIQRTNVARSGLIGCRPLPLLSSDVWCSGFVGLCIGGGQAIGEQAEEHQDGRMLSAGSCEIHESNGVSDKLRCEATSDRQPSWHLPEALCPKLTLCESHGTTSKSLKLNSGLPTNNKLTLRVRIARTVN